MQWLWHWIGEHISVQRRWGITITAVGLCLVIAIGLSFGGSTSSAPKRVLTVALALATGDLGDRAFNDSAYAGLQQAQRDMGTRFRVIAWKGGDEQIESIRHLAEDQPDLILLIGQENASALREIAPIFPDQRFAIVDAAVDAPNVTSIIFRELEGDFLVGALSALMSPSGKVGFLGATDITIIRRIEHGWMQGVRYINPNATIISRFIAGRDDFSGFNAPERALALTTSMFRDDEVGVVYAPAGRSSLGAIAAGRETGGWVITSGTDQRWMAPATVITSRTKNMDAAIYLLISELQQGALAPGVRTLSLLDGGVTLAPIDGRGLPEGSPHPIPLDVRDRMRAIEEDLRAGVLTVKPYQPPPSPTPSP